MASRIYITYRAPKKRFEMISTRIIDNFDCELVGIYCKIVCISSGKSMRMDWMAKKMGIGEKRMRKAIVTLEDYGYIVRSDIRDGKGHISGWNYQVFSEPVEKQKRSCAGRKRDDFGESYIAEKGQVGEEPNLTKSNQVGNGEGIISTNSIYNDIDNNCTINSPVYKEETDNGSAEPAHAPSDEDVFVEKMKKRFPRIMKMEQPLTLKQAKDVKERFGPDLVQKILNEMENWKKLLKNNVSAYMTIIAWCEKEQERL